MITLYTETMKRAAKDEVTLDDDKEIVDEMFATYLLKAVIKPLAFDGCNVLEEDVNECNSGLCHHCSNDADYESMRAIQGFWEWYN